VAGVSDAGIALGDGRVLEWSSVARGRVDVEFTHVDEDGSDVTGTGAEASGEDSRDEDLMDDEQDDGREA
jgi:hypothetical protein